MQHSTLIKKFVNIPSCRKMIVAIKVREKAENPEGS